MNGWPCGRGIETKGHWCMLKEIRLWDCLFFVLGANTIIIEKEEDAELLFFVLFNINNSY